MGRPVPGRPAGPARGPARGRLGRPRLGRRAGQPPGPTRTPPPPPPGPRRPGRCPRGRRLRDLRGDEALSGARSGKAIMKMCRGVAVSRRDLRCCRKTSNPAVPTAMARKVQILVRVSIYILPAFFCVKIYTCPKCTKQIRAHQKVTRMILSTRKLRFNSKERLKN
jgi:hypothetical protein